MALRRSARGLPRIFQQWQASAGAANASLSNPAMDAFGTKPEERSALPFWGQFRGMSNSPIVVSSPTVAALKNPTNIITYDHSNHDRFTPGDPSKRAFTYFVLTGGRFLYASAIRLAVLKFILSMTASKDVLAMASLEVDTSNIEVGQTITVKWRGKPVFIRRREASDIEKANDVDMSSLRDPETDLDRAPQPEWLVVVGVCTHLGCVPIANAGDYNGWFCPCHGSHYDTSGRIRKGPAPYNLEVPEYQFIDESTLVVG